MHVKNSLMFLLIIVYGEHLSASPRLALELTPQQILCIRNAVQETEHDSSHRLRPFFKTLDNGQAQTDTPQEESDEVVVIFKAPTMGILLSEKEYNHLLENFQEVLRASLKDILEDKPRPVSLTFSGYSTGGILAALAAKFTKDNIVSGALGQVRLVTFFAPPLPESIADKVETSLRLENALNFVSHLKLMQPSQGARPIGVQAPILPSEQVSDEGGIVHYVLNRALNRKNPDLYLPSGETLRLVVSHYQYAYHALLDALDHSPSLKQVGDVALLSSTRGVGRAFYHRVLGLK